MPLIGDIELFALARADLPPHKVVGITGTNGKSTTTALGPSPILMTAGVPSADGRQYRPADPGAARAVAEGGVYVLELSSYQLDLTRSLACEAAALINVTPDHLDRYDGFEDYAFSKARLFAMQGSGAFAIFGCDDGPTRAIMRAEAARRLEGRAVCARRAEFDRYQGDWPSLQGPHNLQNAAIAAALARELGAPSDAVLAGLSTFPGLPHRMERLGEHGGVLFVNDSKATNPASTAPALAAYPADPAIHGGSPRIHWICGGLPKGDDLAECMPFLGNLAAAYTIGEAGPLFAELLAPFTRVERCEMLCEATTRALAAARPGDVVLFSPACASFDQFRDYEARGENFRQIVAMLAGGAEPPAEMGLCSVPRAGRSAA